MSLLFQVEALLPFAQVPAAFLAVTAVALQVEKHSAKLYHGAQGRTAETAGASTAVTIEDTASTQARTTVTSLSGQ